MENVKIISPEVCKEIYVILNKLGFMDKLPSEIKEYITENRNIEYEFDFNMKIPLIYQVNNEETKAYLSYLYLKYINDRESEKDMLLKKYIKNEIKYQEKQRQKYNPDEIFKNKQNKTKKNTINENQMIKHKESFLKKIINAVKRKLCK